MDGVIHLLTRHYGDTINGIIIIAILLASFVMPEGSWQ